jgi:hypothetical protein
MPNSEEDEARKQELTRGRCLRHKPKSKPKSTYRRAKEQIEDHLERINF